MHFRITFFLLLLGSISFGQSLDVDSIYNFTPSKLTRSDQERKLTFIDCFWQKVKSDPTKYLPLLRNDLNQPNHNPFFYYDGSILLLSLSNNNSDKNLAASAIARCELADIDRKEYVKTLNMLSNDSINVTNAAVKILYDSSFTFFIPQHVLYFNQGYCLTYMLLPEKQEFYVDTLISVFKTVPAISQKSILTTFWFAYTCKGDSLIKSAIEDSSLSKEVREYAGKIGSYTDLSNNQKGYMKTMDKKEIENLKKRV